MFRSRVAIRGLSMQEQFPVTSSVWDSNRALVTGDGTPVNEPYAYLERICICNIVLLNCNAILLHGLNKERMNIYQT